MASARPLPRSTPAADQLVLDHLGYVRTIAIAYKQALPPFIELADLVSAGYVGLIKAARKFDPRLGVPFRAYSLRPIRGAMQDSIRRGNLKHTSTAQLPDDIDESGLGSRGIWGAPGDHEAKVVADLNRAAAKKEVLRAIHRLSPEEQNMVFLRYYRGLDGNESAEALGIGSTESSQIYRQVLGRLKTRELESIHMKKFVPIDPAVALEAARRAAVVDELGDINAKLGPYRADFTREEKLKVEIRSWVVKDGVGLAEPKTYTGAHYVVDLTASGNQRTVSNMAGVFDHLGRESFLTHCSITLKALEVLLPLEKLRDVIVEGLGGPRKLAVRWLGTPSTKALKKAA